MLRRLFRFVLTLGILGGIAAALAKAFGPRPPAPAAAPSPSSPTPKAWPPLQPVPASEDRPAAPSTKLQPDPDAPSAPAARPTDPAGAWVEPEGGACPTSHPVKAKLGSKIFHLPGMLNYDRTNPDRCYRDAEAAEADGLRPAKR